MARIVKLEIKNFRGIKFFSSKFDRHITCLVGRGDSGKTSVLEAIKYVLSPAWNLTFYDTDFYQLNTSNPLEITISLTDLPNNLISEDKFGLYIQALNASTGRIQDEIEEGLDPVLTIRLIVNDTLEPKWTVVNGRNLEEKTIAANDRQKLNCFMVSDYVDSHFSWGRGNPLYSLFKSEENDQATEKTVLNAIREAKSQVDSSGFPHFDNITNYIKKQAATLGLDLQNIQTTLDFKDINVKEDKVSLHLENIPFRLMGKGSRRLASIAIQTAIARNGGIALIDEIEQGLEPDRVRQITRTLKQDNTGQVIITTHSQHVVTELEANDLLILYPDKETGTIKSECLGINNKELQGVIRACPEAFFAKKVIVCEGSTEVGICRALDMTIWTIIPFYPKKLRGKSPFSSEGIVYVDGSGSSFSRRAIDIKQSGILVSVLCDSDKDECA